VTSLSESSQGEVGDNRENGGDFWEKSIAINQNIASEQISSDSFNYLLFGQGNVRGVAKQCFD
jgi:hypothetical protein